MTLQKLVKKQERIAALLKKFNGDEDEAVKFIQARRAAKQQSVEAAVQHDVTTRSAPTLQSIGVKNEKRINNLLKRFEGDHEKAVQFVLAQKQNKVNANKAIGQKSQGCSSAPTSLQELGIKDQQRIQKLVKRFGGDEEKAVAFVTERRQLNKKNKSFQQNACIAPQEISGTLAGIGIKDEKRIERLIKKFGDEQKAVAFINAKRQTNQKTKGKQETATVCSQEVETLQSLGIKNEQRIHRLMKRFGGDENKAVAFVKKQQAKQQPKQQATKKNQKPEKVIATEPSTNGLTLRSLGIKNEKRIEKLLVQHGGDEQKAVAFIQAKRAAKKQAEASPTPINPSRPEQVGPSSITLSAIVKNPRRVQQLLQRFGDEAKAIEFVQAKRAKKQADKANSKSKTTPTSLTDLVKNGKRVSVLLARFNGNEQEAVKFIVERRQGMKKNKLVNQPAAKRATQIARAQRLRK